MAVDNAGLSPFKGDFYVTNGTSVKVFGPTGVEEGSLNGSGTFKGSLVQACGVAVDQTNGTVYVADKSAKNIWKYVPTERPRSPTPTTR